MPARRDRPHRAFVADRRNGQTWQRQFETQTARDNYVREQWNAGYFAAAWSLVRLPEPSRARLGVTASSLIVHIESGGSEPGRALCGARLILVSDDHGEVTCASCVTKSARMSLELEPVPP